MKKTDISNLYPVKVEMSSLYGEFKGGYVDTDSVKKEVVGATKEMMIEEMKLMLEVQGEHGNWNYDEYMWGMYNGMEFMLARLEGRELNYRKRPERWLSESHPVNVLEKEIKVCHQYGLKDFIIGLNHAKIILDATNVRLRNGI